MPKESTQTDSHTTRHRAKTSETLVLLLPESNAMLPDFSPLCHHPLNLETARPSSATSPLELATLALDVGLLEWVSVCMFPIVRRQR